MKKNYKMTIEELGYTEAYRSFLFDKLEYVDNMREEFQDYEEQGFPSVELYALYKLSQMSVHELIKDMINVIDTLEHKIEQYESTHW